MPLGLATAQSADVRPQDTAAARQVDHWLQAYAATRDPDLRERVVRAYLGMADRLADRFRRSRNTSPEDLRQSARLGLVAAVDRYDPHRGNLFVPYAVACIVGELKRHLRDTTWRVAVPRPAKERALRVCQTVDELYGVLGRSPTVTEVADALDLDQEEVLEAMEAARTRVGASLDGLTDGETSLGDLVAVQEPSEEREDLIVLPQLIAGLPDPERTAVWLYYFQELPQQDIAELLGRSQMSVSRLLRRALRHLREELVASAGAEAKAGYSPPTRGGRID
jgi:RNA polymerase sigma-B factor